MTWIRGLAAAGLSLLFPGAGHALLRDWVRALLFAGLYVSAVALVLPVEELIDAGSMSAMADVLTEESWTTQFLFSFMLLFTAVDAGFRGMGLTPDSRSGNEGPSCPNCGRELDADLEFCHWCTTRLEYPEPEGETAAEANARADEDASGEETGNTDAEADEPEPKTK